MGKKITKAKLSDQIFQSIKKMIINNQYIPGETLRIDHLANEFGVSTTPVREALVRLQSEGLVEISPNKSATVTQIDENSVKDLWGFRLLLESSAAKSVALHCNNADLENLEKEFLNLLQAPDNMPLYIETEKKLDELLFKYTQNKLVNEALQNLKNKAERLMYFTTEKATGYLRVKAVIIAITKEHLEIIEAFKKHDPELAQQKVQEHLQNATKRTLEAIHKYKHDLLP